jgi:two-component system, NarL family, sensor histidine kinase UhpB
MDVNAQGRAAESRSRAESRPARPARPKTLHILCVEDSEFDFDVLIAHLRTNGYNVQAQRVENAGELESALSARSWDAVISDHTLPTLSSLRALAITKAAAPDVPFLIVSAAMGEEIAVDAMLAGADDYIRKGQLGRLVPALDRSLAVAEMKRRQRDAEYALGEERNRLMAITANMPGAVFQMELRRDAGAAQLLHLSDGIKTFARVEAEQLMRGHPLWWKIFVDEDVQRLNQLWREASIDAGALRWQARIHPHWQFPQDRRSRWIEAAAHARRIDGDKILLVGIILDITQQKRAEGLLAKSREQLRELSAHLDNVKEAERGAIAREIHDDIGNTLTGIKAELAWLRNHLGSDTTAQEKLNSVLELVDSTVSASRRIMLALRPGILDYGIIPAVEWQVKEFEKRFGVPCTFQCNLEDLYLPGEISTGLFRILQEALTNVAKHARAGRAEVQLFADEENVSLEVRDDGVGIDTRDQQKANAFGLLGMHERVRNFNGWIDVSGSPGAGTTIMVSIPRPGGPAPDADVSRPPR